MKLQINKCFTRIFELYLTDSFQREVIHSSGGCESSKNKIIDMNINWWIRNIRPNYCISEFKCNLNSNRLSFETCNVFRVIIILYTIDLYVVLIPHNDSKWNKIVSIQTMSNPKILCLPPIANTLRDLYIRFTWVQTVPIFFSIIYCHKTTDYSNFNYLKNSIFQSESLVLIKEIAIKLPFKIQSPNVTHGDHNFFTWSSSIYTLESAP